MGDEHDDEVKVRVDLILRVVLRRELVDMLPEAGDMLFEVQPFGDIIPAVGIVDIGGHRDLRVNDDVALVVEVQQHIGPQAVALVGTDGVAVLVAHHRLHLEVLP